MLKCDQCREPLPTLPVSGELAFTIRIAVTPGGLADYARLCSWRCAIAHCQEEEQILQQEREEHTNEVAQVKHQRIRRVK